jgi:2,4-dienoyl-CoA reductase (NADPH2)
VFPAALRAGRIGALRLANRIIMGSMHLGIESNAQGLGEFYALRAAGGAALIVTGGSCVNRAGAGGRNYSFINEDSSTAPLGYAAQAVHRAGGRIALQLFHAGRYAYRESFGIQPVAPSAIPSRFSPDPPRAMNEAEIEQTIADFASGAQRARSLGFDAVEVMSSEGYLLNQFLSPLTNRRDDAWGGDVKRRMRMPLEVLRAIRKAAGDDFPVIFRISGADLMPGSSAPEEVPAFARRLADEGVDALNIGIGWHESRVPTVQQMVPHGIWVRFAAAVKNVVGDLPVIASNRINTIALADEVIASGAADFVSMARPFLADAAIVSKSERGEAALVNTCIACNQACIDRSLIDAPVSCMVNPRAARELDFPERRTDAPRRFAVVGGGPAGMECARALAALGHRVELFEAESELGGQFRMARRIPGKAEFGETMRYYANELGRLGVTVRLNEAVRDAQTLRGFDGVVLSTGVLPKAISLRGRNLPHVIDYAQVLARDAPTGERIAILGAGGIGVDVAHFLSHGQTDADVTTRFLYEQGLAAPDDGAVLVTKRKTVAVMRRGRSIGERIGKTTRWAVLAALRAAGVSTLTGVVYEAIEPGGIRVRTASGEEQLVEADTVIVAAGQECNDALLDGIRSLGVPYRVIGGAKNAAELDAVRAFEEGLRAAHELSLS